MSYITKIYTEQGGAREVVASGGSLDVQSGGELDIESGGALKLAGVQVLATAAELNLVDAAPANITFAPAAGGTNVCEVTIAVKDAAGVTLAGIRNLEVWLSDAATGAGLTATSASGTVTAKAASGTVLTALTAKKHIVVQTKADGIFILEITDTAKTGFYVAAALPSTGAPIISVQLVTGNYG